MKEQLFPYNFRLLKLIVFISFSSFFGYGQNVITVLDENGDSMIGVHVNYGNVNLVTDIKGQVTIDDNLNANTILQFQYIAYEELSLKLRNIRSHGNIVRMKTDMQLLEEIIIVGRTNQRDVDLPFNIERIKSESIYASNAQNSADALQSAGAAYIQKSQMGGGSPIVRGFEANKLLLVIDGVRMNNAIYRNGHLQNAITVDPSMLEQMEVIYGPGSLLYGSEALGGVIHFRSKTPQFTDDASKNHGLSAYTRFSSGNNEKTFHIHHSYSTKKFGVITGASFSDFSDLRSGKRHHNQYPEFGLRQDYIQRFNGSDSVVVNPDPYIQIGTAYKQADLFQKWLFKTGTYSKLDLNVQYSSSGDIPRYDNLIERRNDRLRYAEWYYGPQKRLLISPKITWNKNGLFFDKALVIASFQNIKEDRVSRIAFTPDREYQNENVDVWGLTLDFEKRINNAHQLMYGLDYHFNKVDSKAESINIENLSVHPILSRYPSGGATMANYGIYINHNWHNRNSSLVWNSGLRWSSQKVNFSYLRDDPYIWPEYFYDGITSDNQAVIGITGLNLNFKPWLIKMSTGTAFRSPNVDDLAKIRVNNDEITVPNPNLKSEKVWNSEITVAFNKKDFSLGITAYYSQLSDAIIRSKFTLPDGQSFFTTGQDSFLVTANTNASSGKIKGLSANFSWQIIKELQFASGINIQSGTATEEGNENLPLGHIPPTFGFIHLKFEKPEYQVKFSCNYNGWKRIEDFSGSVDNPELATPDGSPSWAVINFESQWRYLPNWTLNLAVNNIMDLHYRPFTSGLSSPGRHIVIGIRYDFVSDNS